MSRSKVRLEGTPLRGKGGQELPVLVTPVTESQVSAGDALAFWLSLGYTVSFELVRRGRQASFTFQGLHLQVCSHLAPCKHRLSWLQWMMLSKKNEICMQMKSACICRFAYAKHVMGLKH